MAICLKAPRTPLFVYYAINVSVTNFVCNSRCLYCLYCVYCVYFAWVLCWLGLLPWYLNTLCIIRMHTPCTIFYYLHTPCTILYYPHTSCTILYYLHTPCILLSAHNEKWFVLNSPRCLDYLMGFNCALFCIELNTVCSGFIVFTLLAEIHLDGPSMETFLSNRHTISDDHDWWWSSMIL